jgi:hypothetical protein
VNRPRTFAAFFDKGSHPNLFGGSSQIYIIRTNAIVWNGEVEIRSAHIILSKRKVLVCNPGHHKIPLPLVLAVATCIISLMSKKWQQRIKNRTEIKMVDFH